MFPKEWDKVSLKSLLSKPIQNGYSPVCDEKPNDRWILGLGALGQSGLDISRKKPAPKNDSKVDQYLLSEGDFLVSRSNTIDKVGRSALFRGEIKNCAYSDLMMRFRVWEEKVCLDYLAEYLRSEYALTYLRNSAAGTSASMKKINKPILEKLIILLPPIYEQKRIAEILAVWDEAIALTKKAIEANQKQKKHLAYRLLFGKSRVMGLGSDCPMEEHHWFSASKDWKVVHIKDIAKDIGNRNISSQNLPVLSCTKHFGLVDSLKYFGKQIFSEDTSTYKVVAMRQFVYATNHIEEGSIGYQDIYHEALISPMYTVFETTTPEVDDGYLYKLLKTETFRRIFQANTSASVDRRGSLRWKQFSEIKIPLPPIAEQREINCILNTAQAEIDKLLRYKDLLQNQKQGLMQKLLTGEWRVALQEAA